MAFETPNFVPAIPEIFVMTMACLVLVVDVYIPERYRLFTYQLAQFTLVAGALIAIFLYPDEAVTTFGGTFVSDGMSSVLKEYLTIEDGRVKQSNFNDYELLRMSEIPETIETAIIASNESPQGVGESGTPLVACAIANAFFSLTGKRLRHLPFTPKRVLDVLAS